MATVTATSPIKGKQPGETVNCTAAEAAWFVHEGYATDMQDGADHVNDTAIAFKELPTEAENFSDSELEKRAAQADKAENAPEVGKGEPGIPAPVDPSTGSNEAPDLMSQTERLRRQYEGQDVELRQDKPAGTNDNVPANPPIDDIEAQIQKAKETTKPPKPTKAKDLNLQAEPPSADDLEAPAVAPVLKPSE